MSLSLRLATTEDVPLLAQMNRRLIEDEGSRNPMSVDELQQRLSSWLSDHWTVQLFMEQKAAVGYAVYTVRQDEYDPDQPVILRQFYLEREKRSRGLGSLAFQSLAQTHFPAGSRIVIDVLASNPRGHKFWSKLGFRPYCTTMHLERP